MFFAESCNRIVFHFICIEELWASATSQRIFYYKGNFPPLLKKIAKEIKYSCLARIGKNFFSDTTLKQVANTREEDVQ